MISLSYGIPVITEATKRSRPNGGVIKPMESPTIKTIPQWIGFIPIDIAMGARIGARMMHTEMDSIIAPAKTMLNIMAPSIT